MFINDNFEERLEKNASHPDIHTAEPDAALISFRCVFPKTMGFHHSPQKDIFQARLVHVSVTEMDSCRNPDFRI